MKSIIKNIKEEIIDQYVNDPNPRPWIIGFSGGKDSTMLLQLVWFALKSIDSKKLKRKIYVINNNTLVENPKILEYCNKVVKQINKEAVSQSLPIIACHTTPKLEETFWVNMIGKGYPAPNSMFRWCTERLKINPTTKFIKETIDENGEVIILLGTRSDESSKRASSIKKHEIKGQRLRKHLLPNAYVYAPIVDVKTQEVWQYLSQVENPWGSSNKELITLYRNADSSDCPLVIDTSTPSCGNSRFGCWVCTVIQKDSSMLAMIDNGEEWMEPLIEIRDYLQMTRYDHSHREIKIVKGEERIGPYKPEVRKNILEMLFKAQKEIRIEHPEIELLNYQELVAIQIHWFRKNIFNFKVSDIYYNVFNEQIIIDTSNKALEEEKELLKNTLNDESKFNLVNELLDIQQTRTLLMHKKGIFNDLDTRINQFLKNKSLTNVY